MVSQIQPNSLANAWWSRIIGFRGISGQWVVVSKDQWTCLLFHRLCREQLNAFVKTRGWSPSSSPPPLQISPPPPPCRWLSWLIWTNNPLLPPVQGQVQVQPLQTYTTNSERNANLVATRELFQSLIIKPDHASAKSMVCPREKVKSNPQ